MVGTPLPLSAKSKVQILYPFRFTLLLNAFYPSFPETNSRKLEFVSVAGSGLFMSSFVFLHIPTTISAIMGPYGYNEALNFFRYVQE